MGCVQIEPFLFAVDINLMFLMLQCEKVNIIAIIVLVRSAWLTY